MKKKILFCITALVISLTFASCSSSNTNSLLDGNNIAFEAISGVEYFESIVDESSVQSSVVIESSSEESSSESAIIESSSEESNSSIVESSSEVVASSSTASESSTVESSSEETPSSETTVDTTDYDKYVEMFQGYLNDGNGLTITEEASDIEGYTTKNTVKVRNIDGTYTVYVMYYTETLQTTTSTLKNSKHHDYDHFDRDDDDDDDDDNIKTKSTIEGILIVNDVEYSITGKKTVENDETELKLIAYIDDANYIKIEEEVEDDEISYEYSVYTDGKKVSKTEIEVENERGKLEIEISNSTVDSKVSYSFLYDETTGTIVVKHKVSGTETIKFVVTETLDAEGNPVYSYSEYNSYKKNYDENHRK